MAIAKTHECHNDLIGLLVDSENTTTPGASAETGPFETLREAYIFAAAIGFAIGEPAADGVATSKGKTIKQEVFENADGAIEVRSLAALLGPPPPLAEERLEDRLQAVAADDQAPAYATLDRYARTGFDWLQDRRQDEPDIRGLILSAIEELGRV